MAESYELRKAAARKRSATLNITGRDIGDLPGVADPARKEAAQDSLQCFLATYFPASPALALEDLLRAEAGVRGGLLTAPGEVACPAVLWALLFGSRRHVVLLAKDETSARTLIDDLKRELVDGDLLLEDFPEVCYPLTQRRRIPGWSKNAIVLPETPGSAASGATVRAMSPRDRIAGLLEPRPDLIAIVVD